MFYGVTRIKRDPNLEQFLKYYKQFLPYKNYQLQRIALQGALNMYSTFIKT
jgi:hypothetical protein